MALFSMSNLDLQECLYNGGVGVLPTDTVYGLVCSALHPEAVARLYTLKHREQKPGIIIAADANQVISLGIEENTVRLVEQFWPGVSIELFWGDRGTYLHQGTGRSAFRVVANGELNNFLKKTGPLVTSSANLPSRPPANTIAEAQAYFGDTVDFYVDGGDLSGRQSSTLIRVKEGVVEVLRQGSISFPAPLSS